MHDVIVVGAGCVGSYAARILAEKGHDVQVVDKDREVGDSVNCSGIIGAEAFSSLDLPEGAIQNVLRSLIIFGPSGSSVPYRPTEPLAYIVNRAHFDQLLAKRAQAKGAIYSMDTFVERVEVDESGVRLEVLSAGERKTIEAKVCIMASGFGGRGPSIPGIGEIRKSIQGVQLEAEMADVETSEIHLGRSVTAGSFAWIVPTGNGKCKVGLLARAQGGDLLRKFLEVPCVAERLLRWDGKIRANMIPLSPITKSYSDRILVMGEAAGQTKITTAGGIYYGFLCAKIGAEVLEKAFEKNDFSEKTLLPYEARWKTLLKEEQRMGTQLVDIFSKLSDRQIDAVVELARVDGIMPMAEHLFRFDWHAPFISGLLKKQFKVWASKVTTAA